MRPLREEGLWEQIYEVAAAAGRDPACLQYRHLLSITEDLADRGSSLARSLLDEALIQSRTAATYAPAVRADLLAKMGDEAGYLELASTVEATLPHLDRDDRETVGGYLAAGAEELGRSARADDLARYGELTSLLARIAADRGRVERARSLVESTGFGSEHWSEREKARFALARAYSRGAQLEAAREQIAAAELAARAEKKKKEVRWIHLARVATVYADVGATADARRLALELDKAMFEKVAPRGSAQYEEISVILHRAGDAETARKIALQHVGGERVRMSPHVAARLWARLGEAARAREVLEPLEKLAVAGQLPGMTSQGELARVHLALGDVAAALHRAAAERDLDHRVGVLRDIAAYAHEHATAANPAIEQALAAVLARVSGL